MDVKVGISFNGDFPKAKYPAEGADPGQQMRSLQQAERAFTYHPPKEDQPPRYVALRDAAKAYAELVIAYTPPGREQALALTKLEEAVMWANAAIARGE